MIILLVQYSVYVPLLIISMPNLLQIIPSQKPNLFKTISCQKKQTLKNKKEIKLYFWSLFS